MQRTSSNVSDPDAAKWMYVNPIVFYYASSSGGSDGRLRHSGSRHRQGRWIDPKTASETIMRGELDSGETRANRETKVAESHWEGPGGKRRDSR